VPIMHFRRADFQSLFGIEQSRQFLVFDLD
jgi:hypothetical protein